MSWESCPPLLIKQGKHHQPTKKVRYAALIYRNKALSRDIEQMKDLHGFYPAEGTDVWKANEPALPAYGYEKWISPLLCLAALLADSLLVNGGGNTAKALYD